MEDAHKLMKHSKRDVLSTTDLNTAFQLSNIRPFYGHKDPEKVRFLRSQDDKELFVEEEKELDFATILSAELPSCPRECTFDVSWLVVHGKQPDIPQNPRIKRKLSEMESTDQVVREPQVRGTTQAWAQAAALQKAKQARAKALADQLQQEAQAQANSAVTKRKTYDAKITQEPPPSPRVPEDDVIVKPATPHELSKELQLYIQKVEEAIVNMGNLANNILEKTTRDKKIAAVPTMTASASTTPATHTNTLGAKKADVFPAEKPLKTVEWKELFYSLNHRNNNNIRFFVTALHSLIQDPGLYKLLPYLIDFVCKNVPKYVGNLGLLKSLMQVVTALSMNRYLDFDEHLHQLLPVMLTCVVRPQLGADSIVDHHWSLRDYSALLVSTLVRRSNKKNPSFEARVTKFFVDNLVNLQKPPTSHYGALRALSFLGPQCIKIVVFPMLDKFVNGIREKLKSSKDPIFTSESLQCLAVMLENTGVFVKSAMAALELERLKEGTWKKTKDQEETEGSASNGKKRKPKGEKELDQLQITTEDCVNHYSLIQQHFQAGLVPYTGHITHFVDIFI
eukprot:TRINITY_DN8611_c0_g1_i1.p1 TRINITY_DN8611_c0_g1~~TRINITY_DN8611_c0_g1_i1.p1  ORF type:complete len:615 (+),score=100.61 TRINITY_DN8611_c0_g1_i1:153-1847(+)